jgi:hypothetical protein
MQRQGMRLAAQAQNTLNTYQQAANRELEAITNNADELTDSALQKAGEYVKGAYTRGKDSLKKWAQTPLASKIKSVGKTLLKYGLPIAATAVGAHYIGDMRGYKRGSDEQRSFADASRRQIYTQGNKVIGNLQEQIKEKDKYASEVYKHGLIEHRRRVRLQKELVDQGARHQESLQQHKNLIQTLENGISQLQDRIQSQPGVNNQPQPQLEQELKDLQEKLQYEYNRAEHNYAAAANLQEQYEKRISKLKTGHRYQQMEQTAAQAALAQAAIGKVSEEGQRAIEQANYELELQKGATAQWLRFSKDLWDHSMAKDKEERFYYDPTSFTVGERDRQSFPASFSANTLYRQNNSQPTRLTDPMPLKKKTSTFAPLYKYQGETPQARRLARVATLRGKTALAREIARIQKREAQEVAIDQAIAQAMQTNAPLAVTKRQQDEETAATKKPKGGKKKAGKGWADAARAFAPFMQTGFKVYQNHQYNEAARQKREMLAERLGVSPHDLEGLSSRGLLE